MSAKKAKESNDLARLKTGKLSSRATKMTIASLERALLAKFPAAQAEEWDRTGLLVGDPSRMVSGVALALDPTVFAIREASAVGANVLISHHPAYLDPPTSFVPEDSTALNPGAGVWEAVERKVALMCFHTALDVSKEAAQVLPGMLRLKQRGILSPLSNDTKKGYGQICAIAAEDEPLSLGQFAARCTSVFGHHPRVWGDFNRKIRSVVTCTGAIGDLTSHCLAAHIDLLVCGEIRYHDALAASQAGLSIIDLGHDTSELPLVAVLASAVEAIGVPKEEITLIDQAHNWDSPESTRV